MHVPLFRPTMRRRYMHAVLTQLVDEDIGPGKITRELTSSLSAYIGAAGGVAVTGTYASLILAAEALGLKPGDRVVVSALAPSVYLDVLRFRGLEVVLVDCEPDTGRVSADSLRPLVGSGAKAVFAHDAWGLPFAHEPASEAGIPVVRDATYSLAPAPATEGALVPDPADLVLLSLDGTGAIAAGGGAALLSGRRALLPALKSAAGNLAGHQQLPNYGAALALALLHDVDNDRARRLEIVGEYRSAVQKSRHATLSAGMDARVPAYAFVVRLKDSVAEVRQYARKHGVETAPAYEQSCVAVAGELASGCPNARKLLLCCLLFPLYPMLGRKDVEGVCRVLATLP
jgi:perosamine synthetase